MNPLKSEIDDFLLKIGKYESLNYQTKTHLTYRINNVKTQIEKYNGIAPAIGTSLIIGDISGPTDNGWKFNYHTGVQTKIARDDMIASIESLIRQNGMTFFANCYEILESYLFNIIGEFLNKNPSYQKNLPKKKINVEDKKVFLRKYCRSKNNKDLLKLLRIISPKFKYHEVTNNTGLNLTDWFYVITNVRHAIVHSLNFIEIDKLNFNRAQLEILNFFFSIESIDNKTKLNLSFDQSKKQINLIAEYGFLIFKCLSMETNEDWKILKNHNK